MPKLSNSSSLVVSTSIYPNLHNAKNFTKRKITVRLMKYETMGHEHFIGRENLFQTALSHIRCVKEKP